MDFLLCLLYLLILVLEPVKKVFGNVYWDVQTHPVVFEENVGLYCNTSSVQDKCKYSQCTSRWYGGQIQNLLSSNGLTVNQSKYETYEDSSGFSLVIKQFKEEDANILYSCTYGFYADKKKLQLPNDFEIQPVNETTDIRLHLSNGSILNVQVNFKKVHPQPTCSIFHNGENVSSKLISERHQEGIFYLVTMYFQHNLKSDGCIGKIQLECTIGTRNRTVVSQNLDSFCSVENSVKDENGQILIIVGLVVVTMLCVTCAVIFTLIRKKERIPDDKEETTQKVLPEPESSQQKESKICGEEREMLNKDKQTSDISDHETNYSVINKLCWWKKSKHRPIAKMTTTHTNM